MDDRVGVHVVAGADELRQVEARFGLGVALADAEEVEEGLAGSGGCVSGEERRGGRGKGAHAVGAQLELHVDVALVLEAVLEGDHVGVLHGLVDLDLGKELRARIEG